MLSIAAVGHRPSLLLFVVAALAAATVATLPIKIGRMMPGANFPGHNIEGGGCSPVVPVPQGMNASGCQRKCDSLQRCHEWTYVPSISACCLKDCSCGGAAVGMANPQSCCPAPNRLGPPSTSGVKNPSSYIPSTPRAHGTTITIEVNCSASPSCVQSATSGPQPTASLRKASTVFFDGRLYMFADYIPFGAIRYPDSYNTTIHVFSRPAPALIANSSLAAAAISWTHHGLALGPGAAGQFDAGGVATPSAVVVPEGGPGKAVVVLLAYSGRRHVLPPTKPIHGTRGIGLATASHPLGPFIKKATPVVLHDGYADDPQLIAVPAPRPFAVGRISHDVPQQQVWLYHRLEASNEVRGCGSIANPTRCLRLLTSDDGGAHWLEHRKNICVEPTPHSRLTSQPISETRCLADTAEPLDAKIIDGRVVLLVDQPDRVFVSQPLAELADSVTGLVRAPTTLSVAVPLSLPHCVATATLGLLSFVPTDAEG